MTAPAVSVPKFVPRLILLALSIIGWALFARMIVINLIATLSLQGESIEGLGVDTYAYWLAGSSLIDGSPIYTARSISELGAYLYPPMFAQAWVPMAMLPEVVADWGWRLLGLLSIRYMAGSWLISGLWMLFPGTIVELTAGNVTLQVAALTVAGLRGRAEGVLPAAAVKFSAVAIVPFLWLRRPAARRGLLVGGAIALTMVIVSVAIDTGVWRDYFEWIRSQGDVPFDSPSVLHILPTTGPDYLLRLGVAAIVVVVSVRLDSPHLASIAAIIATPTMWEQRLSVSFALPTLEGGAWLKPYLWPGPRSKSTRDTEAGVVGAT